MNVAVRAHARKRRVDPALDEPLRLVKHLRVDHLADAPLDGGDQRLTRRA